VASGHSPECYREYLASHSGQPPWPRHTHTLDVQECQLAKTRREHYSPCEASDTFTFIYTGHT
jgi:hypothetical protein